VGVADGVVVSPFGAVEYQPGRLLWHISLREDSEAFLAFREREGQAFPDDQTVLMLDDAGEGDA
jgi:hypothetical protein